MPDQSGNAGQAATEHRVSRAALFDAEIHPHNALFRVAAAIGPADRVLDIGCGTGQSAREAARAATAGGVLGVDLSEPALEHARRVDGDVPNLTYLKADAQTHAFPEHHFDVIVSRFGAMFFADPAAAFANLVRAARPGARLVLLVWQPGDRNEWCTAVRRAIGTQSPPGDGQGAFSLGDTAVAESVLTAAGWSGVGFTDVHEPVYYGPDTATAYDLVLGLRGTQALLTGLDETAAAQARERLRALLTAHTTPGGVFFDSRSWIITAQVPNRA